MNPVLERLYYRAPIALQNLAVSLMGLKLYRQRYAGDAPHYLESLRQSEKLDAVELRHLQEREFVRLAQRAITQVPHYREWAEREGIRPQDIRTLDELALFPVLEKGPIRDDPERFLSDEAGRNVFAMSTSGTTGTPLTIYSDPASRTYHYAFMSRLRSWFGVGVRGRRATLLGRIIMQPDQATPPFWRHDVAQKNLLMSSYHLAQRNLQHYYGKLRQFQPEEIFGYPSSIYEVARYVVESGLTPLQTKLVMTTAEPLLAYQREVIEQAFTGAVVNQYGCTEMAFFAAECEQGVMHLHPEHGLAEVLDEHGTQVQPGESGELVATGLVNSVMPLIRYRTGDRVRLGREPCECGRAFPVLAEVEGRIDDTLYRQDGTPVGRLDPVFKGGSGIVEAQIIQHGSGNVTVRVVPAADYSEQHRNWIMYEIGKRMGRGLEVDVEAVSSIPRTASGKFKAVIREQ